MSISEFTKETNSSRLSAVCPFVGGDDSNLRTYWRFRAKSFFMTAEDR